MFTSTRKVAKGIIKNASLDDNELLVIPSQSLPNGYSLPELQEEVADDEAQNAEEELESLLILDSCLNDRDRLSKENDDGAAIKQLALWVAKVILPQGDIIAQCESSDDSSSSARNKALTLVRQKAKLGLNSLNILITQLSSSPPKTLPESILLTLISFSSHSPYTPWTSALTAQIGTSILSHYKHQTHTQSFQITYILQTILRPLFSASKPETITSTGRKAITPSAPARQTGTEELQKSRKPWKYDAVYAISVFRWVVEKIPRETIPQTWHNFTPPFLTLLDDPSTPIRVQGADILSIFLPHMSSTLLSQSGLGELFEDALMPTLLYLPNLTPLSESIQLLPSAYNALIVLCDARFPLVSTEESKVVSLTSRGPKTEKEKEKEKEDSHKKERTKFLDNVMRKGVFMGYIHAMEHPQIVSILITHHRILTEKMGLESVKHLKDTLPLLTTPLVDPFSTLSLILTSLLTLQTTILNTWPRLLTQPNYQLETIKMLSLCWKNVFGLTQDTSIEEKQGRDVNEELANVMKELKITGRMFMKAAEGAGVDLTGEVGVLVESVEGVGEIFGV